MIDLTKYLHDDDDICFVEHLRNGLVDCLCEALLDYKGLVFSVEPCDGKIIVFVEPDIVDSEYETFDDFLVNFLIDGKPFIECVPNIDYS